MNTSTNQTIGISIKKYDLFISYSRKDSTFVKEICKVLDEYKKHYKFEYFFDCEEITSKHDYLERISSAISQSKAILFLASKNSLTSEFCLKELLFADKEHVYIYQYRLDYYDYPKPIQLLLGNFHYRETCSFSIEKMAQEILNGILEQEITPLSNLENDQLDNTIIISNFPNNLFINANKLNSEDFILDLDGIKFRFIKIHGGEFKPWSIDSQTTDDELVKVFDFWMSETTVTDHLIDVVFSSTVKDISSKEYLPKEFESANECIDFINKLNFVTEGIRPKGTKFRIPTELEWEYAARGGINQDKYIYSGSNNANEVAHYFDFNFENQKKLYPVAQKRPNSLGLYDMSGNQNEVCIRVDYINHYFDCRKDFIKDLLMHIPVDKFFIPRGGSCLQIKECCLIRYRRTYGESFLHSVGLRIVLSDINSNLFD